jgi:phage gp45-like
MLGPSRVLPRVGAHARVAHFGGGYERGTIVSVSDDARRVEVLCEGGETLAFVLSPATARFVAAGGAHGPRLELLGG